MKRRLMAVIGGLALAITVFWIATSWVARRSRFQYAGTVETREIEIGSKVGGRVTEVPVEEGEAVQAGAVLVRFECDELKAQRGQAAALLEQAQADLKKMRRGSRPEEIAEAEATARAAKAAFDEAQNGPRRQEIDQARAEYSAAQADAANADNFYRRTAQLANSDIVSKQQFDDARDRRDAAEQKAESARQRLALLEAGTRAEDVRAAEARYQQAESAAALARKGFRKEDVAAAEGRALQAQGQVDELDARLREATLLAPADAVLETVSVRPGNLVPAGRIVMTMLETSQLWVKVYVPETDLAEVHLGQRATVQVDSYTGRSFTGKVGQIASEAEFMPRNVQTKSDREHQVFGVKVYVDNAQSVLKSGMSATVRLE